MKRKSKAVTGAALILLAVAFLYQLIGNPLVAYRNHKLRDAVISVREDEITLNEVLPFEWETVYTFDPYTSRTEIEKTIGFRSSSIRETVSEGMVQLLFVKGDSVVASVCSHADALGYRINFSDSVTRGEMAVFSVRKDSGITVLTKK